MKARGKSSSTPHPIWIYGDYITNPPKRPNGEKRHEGHYIDKGGYPGANVYEISPETLCKQTSCRDLTGREIYEKDYVRYDFLGANEKLSHIYCLAYFGVEGNLEFIDILTGEIIDVQDMEEKHIKVIGNLLDNNSFKDELFRYVYEAETHEIPYIPIINVQYGTFPYWVFKCRKCHHISYEVAFKATCPNCGGLTDCNLASEYKKESVSV